MGLRKTVKLSPRPRPSTDSAKHGASTLSATRSGFSGFVGVSCRGVFRSMTGRERVFVSASKGQKRMRLCRLEQDVALFAKRQFYHAFRGELGGLQDHLLIRNCDVVDAQPAALDLAARLAIRGDKSGPDERRQHADAGVEFPTRNLDAWQVFRDRAFFKCLPRGFGGSVRGIAAVQERGRL